MQPKPISFLAERILQNIICWWLVCVRAGWQFLGLDDEEWHYRLLLSFLWEKQVWPLTVLSQFSNKSYALAKWFTRMGSNSRESGVWSAPGPSAHCHRRKQPLIQTSFWPIRTFTVIRQPNPSHCLCNLTKIPVYVVSARGTSPALQLHRLNTQLSRRSSSRSETDTSDRAWLNFGLLKVAQLWK